MTEMRLVIQLPTLIEAIRKRRVLYDAKTPCNAVLKKKNWEDVAKEVSDDHYMNMTEEEQDLFSKLLALHLKKSEMTTLFIQVGNLSPSHGKTVSRNTRNF